jgi:hypothetical protein
MFPHHGTPNPQFASTSKCSQKTSINIHGGFVSTTEFSHDISAVIEPQMNVPPLHDTSLHKSPEYDYYMQDRKQSKLSAASKLSTSLLSQAQKSMASSLLHARKIL